MLSTAKLAWAFAHAVLPDPPTISLPPSLPPFLPQSGLKLKMAAAMRDTYYGMWHKKPVLLGQAVDTCGALLQFAAEMQCKGPVIDSSLHEELNYSYQCRLLNVMTANPGSQHAHTFSIYEIQEFKEVVVC